MIKELSRDLVTLIHKDYPELEELNLSSNGKCPAVLSLTKTILPSYRNLSRAKLGHIQQFNAEIEPCKQPDPVLVRPKSHADPEPEMRGNVLNGRGLLDQSD